MKECKCQSCKNFEKLDIDDEDEIDFDEDYLEELKQEKLEECACGAYQWSKIHNKYIQIADCICGKG